MQKFIKKPIVIEAEQWNGKNFEEIERFMQSELALADTYSNTLVIPTLEGPLNASLNDWIIKGVQGEFYPCKPDIFEKTYEAVEA